MIDFIFSTPTLEMVKTIKSACNIGIFIKIENKNPIFVRKYFLGKSYKYF